ncbi:NACHT domain-containing protein [Streptomyces sp. NPDC048255]|uniref:NACHT domain-containing protein n=1 Tax=Streptomyces sp. NPDC048255 TaxID=3154713 RepID=UPI0033D8B980
MDASVAGIRLASGVLTPLINKLFQGEGAGAGLVDKPVRFSAYFAWREKRDLDGDDLRGLADDLVKKALRAPGERPLPRGDEAGVAAALTATLRSLGNLTLSDVEAVDLGPQAFARKLRAAAPSTGLSRDAELFHDRLLDLACLHILHFFTQRSTFVAATLMDQKQRLAEAIAKLDILVNRVHLPDARDAAFEERYLAYLAERHSALTIFGLDLAPGSSRWPLDAAYVSLEVNGPTPEAEAGPVPEAGPLQEPAEAPEGAHVAEAGPASAAGVEVGPARSHLPADQLFTEHKRVLLRGEAGSGKTTLCQWLAVRAAKDGEDGRIPFVLPLRSLTRNGEQLPDPRGFLTGSPLAGEVPQGWENRVMGHGRALLLVDGIDEIPEAERPRARVWLAGLIAAYPNNHWLLTSRPSAVRQDWLAAEGFDEVLLTPMTPANVRAFVERWHTAAVTGSAVRDAALPELRTQLLHSVRTKPDLARLATNPLLCGMICALHRERRGFLPSGRKELYTAALSMLLHRRDRERDVPLPEIAEEPQLQLLQRLAYWLIRNGRTEMDRSQAEDLIAAALPAVEEAGRVLGTAPAVLKHLVERTGLLRAPTEETVEFVHRTFQDFLGARAALDEAGFGELASHAEADQWEDVIRMAVAQGRPLDREAVIRGLLATPSPRSVLLAFASLEYATELNPLLRREVEAAASALIPPQSLQAAYALGRVGPLVLDLLPGPEAASLEGLGYYTVVAAGSVGSDLAIPLLARYARHDSALVQSRLAEFWPRFDSRQYAEEVIARLPRIPETLAVHSDAELEALGEFAPQERLNVAGPVSYEGLAAYRRRTPITALRIRGNARLTGLGFLRGELSLRTVTIKDCPALTDLGALAGLPVERAQLHLDGPLDVAAVTSGWESLRQLSLSGPHAPWSLDDLSPRASLRALALGQSPGSLAGLARHDDLRILRLPETWVPAGPSDWQAVASLRKLRELTVPPQALAYLPDTLRLPLIRTLRLYGIPGEADPDTARRLSHHFPEAQTTPVG